MRERSRPRGALVGLALATLLPAVSGTPAGAEPGLTPTERRIVRAIDAAERRALDLLAETVDINSGTMNFDGVRAVGERFATEFERLGFDTRWIDGATFGRAGHLVAERDGDGPRVLLIGHLDTVFEPDSPFQKWERVSATEARGPGVTDMKGGNVVMLTALEALDSVGALDNLRLAVVLTGDEERSGRPLDEARAALRAAARDADFAIGFEDGDGNPETAVIARRGSSSWRLTVRGTPSHSSQIFQPEVGAGAINEAARILTAFRKRLSDLEDLTFNPGVMLGGTDVDFDAGEARGEAFGKNNVVAEHAVVTGDLRAISPDQYAEAVRRMRAVASESTAGTGAELVFDDGYPPMAPSDGNRRLLARYDRASRDLGYGSVAPVDPRRAGAADVSFIASQVPEVLDGLGLMGRGGHTTEETADLTTFRTQTGRAALLLYRLAVDHAR